VVNIVFLVLKYRQCNWQCMGTMWQCICTALPQCSAATGQVSKEPQMEGLHPIGDWQAAGDTPDCLVGIRIVRTPQIPGGNHVTSIQPTCSQVIGQAKVSSFVKTAPARSLNLSQVIVL